ncbi:MAG TPA: hypothetical protein VM753_21060 [Anaeromyxobacter sp.]|nr:hypothetical protein [Anaeromyxobacter sp.]
MGGTPSTGAGGTSNGGRSGGGVVRHATASVTSRADAAAAGRRMPRIMPANAHAL